MKKILFTFLFLSLFSAKGQIGIQLTSFIPVSEISNYLNAGYGIELGYLTTDQEDSWINYNSIGYREFAGKNVYTFTQNGQAILSSYEKYEDFKEYSISTYSDFRLYDKEISPIIGLGASIVYSTYKWTTYTNYMSTTGVEIIKFGFILMPRLGIVYDVSYNFTFTAGISYALRINGLKKQSDKFLNPFLGITYFF